jgi:hypothetical protein
MSTHTDDEIAAHLLALEQVLLDPAVRRDRSRVARLLAEDFVEIGSSGRLWLREEILTLLETEVYAPPALEDFACRLVAPGVALATYQTLRTDAQTGTRQITLRSSIWVHDTDEDFWRIRFHQGTRVP